MTPATVVVSTVATTVAVSPADDDATSASAALSPADTIGGRDVPQAEQDRVDEHRPRRS